MSVLTIGAPVRYERRRLRELLARRDPQLFLDLEARLQDPNGVRADGALQKPVISKTSLPL